MHEPKLIGAWGLVETSVKVQGNNVILFQLNLHFQDTFIVVTGKYFAPPGL